MTNAPEPPPDGKTTHGTAVAVAVDREGPLAGVLLLGPSGSGKSSLAIGLIETCRWGRTVLVADDQVILTSGTEGLFATAPARLAGLIEVRGFGVVRVSSAPTVRLQAAFDLGEAAERLPEHGTFAVDGGLSIPRFQFVAHGQHFAEAVRLRFVLRAIISGQF